ncbi:sugar ABC transporter substrate-binding protein [Pseudomonas gingeri]|uniref:Sugar ABC transporter substrate-binding protein n=1 Tax=Pseudomonas gingeri TaxID=117681 RepID=A0A7Y7XBM2_9PSED|nr:sugar ABC transporter substrate-binding protein [Pseudomonas gingeri]NWB95743.1 sugar ABC transporter substrate-binding protein [Pseudomonas gingeri]
MFKANVLRRLLRLAGVCVLFAAGVAQAESKSSKVIFLGADDVCSYCAAYNSSLRDYAKEKGLDLEIVTNKFDPAQQASQIDQAIARKPAVILLWAIDGAALVPAIRKIDKAGIPLLLTDVLPDRKFEKYWKSYSGADNEAEGRLAAQLMVDGFKDKGFALKGDVITITGIVSQAQVIDRSRGFSEELARLAPDIKIVGTQPGNWDQGVATDATAGLLTRYGQSIKGIYAHEDAMVAGSIVALERAGMDPGKLSIVSVGCEPTGVSLIKAGKLYATVLQSPVDDARYAIDNVVDYLAGKPLEKMKILPMPAVTNANIDDVCKPWPAG